MKLLAVLSGGMDSTAAIAYMNGTGHNVIAAINFNYGSKHNEQERLSARDVAAFYGIPLEECSLDFVANKFKSDLLKTGGEIPEGHYADPTMKKTVVPFRNGIMLSIAAGYAESIDADGILIGNHAGDHTIYPDCRAEFIVPMIQAIHHGTYKNIQLESPFVMLSKTKVAELGSKHGAPFELTYSCYKGGVVHCGVCGTCFERKEAFREAGVDDTTRYLA